MSAALDRQGTPWPRMFDALGRRVDEVLYPPDHRALLLRGCQAGVVGRAFDVTRRPARAWPGPRASAYEVKPRSAWPAGGPHGV